MKIINFLIGVGLLVLSAQGQAQSKPIRVKEGGLVQVMIDSDKEITHSVRPGQFTPVVDIKAYVGVNDCMDTFPEIEDMMISYDQEIGSQTSTVRLYVFASNDFSTCIGLDSRPTTISIDPGISDPKLTVIKQLNGKMLHIETLTVRENNEWVVKFVKIVKDVL